MQTVEHHGRAVFASRRIALRVGLVVGRGEPRARLREYLFAIGDVEVAWVADRMEDAERRGAPAGVDAILLDTPSLAADAEDLTRALACFGETPLVALGGPADGVGQPGWVECGLSVLTSPVSAEDLAAALDEVRESGIKHRTGGLPAPHRPSPGLGPAEPVAWLLAELPGGSIAQVPIGDVLWVEAVHNAVRVHTRDAALQLRIGISRLAERLPADAFVRIHRSSVVNLDAVREVGSAGGGQTNVRLVDGAILAVTNACRGELLARLNARKLLREARPRGRRRGYAGTSTTRM